MANTPNDLDVETDSEDDTLGIELITSVVVKPLKVTWELKDLVLPLSGSCETIASRNVKIGPAETLVLKLISTYGDNFGLTIRIKSNENDEDTPMGIMRTRGHHYATNGRVSNFRKRERMFRIGENISFGVLDSLATLKETIPDVHGVVYTIFLKIRPKQNNTKCRYYTVGPNSIGLIVEDQINSVSETSGNPACFSSARFSHIPCPGGESDILNNLPPEDLLRNIGMLQTAAGPSTSSAQVFGSSEVPNTESETAMEAEDGLIVIEHNHNETVENNTNELGQEMDGDIHRGSKRGDLGPHELEGPRKRRR